MDILKILTRGIPSGGRKPGQSTAPTANLPSAGNVAHPQLFHDEIPSKKGKKRKRAKKEGAGGEVAVDEDSDVSDIDYFATQREDGDEDQSKAAVIEEQASTTKKKRVKLMSEDDCRQILKSHRLKFTVLASRKEEAVEQEQPTKKRRKEKQDKDGKGEKKGKKDNHKKELYPQPLNTFSELQDLYGVPAKLVENLAEQGFKLPTEVQMGSLPLLLKPKKALTKTETDDLDVSKDLDFVAVAPTGSGKTITFLIPAITNAMRRLEKREGEATEKEHILETIVVAPTRELANQIVNEGRKLAMGTGVRIYSMQRGIQLGTEDVVEHQEEDEVDSDHSEGEEAGEGINDESDSDGDSSDGGKTPTTTNKKTSSRPQRTVQPDILVTTPKSLLNLLTSKSGIRRTLPTVTSLNLDEADVLLDPLFRKQTLSIWKSCTSPSLRLTFWSATMASNIESLVLKYTAKRSHPPPLLRLVVGLKDTAVPNITHKLIYTATEPGKLLALRQLLHPTSTEAEAHPLRPPFLIFTQTIPRATALHNELKYDIPAAAGGSSRIAVLHSSLSPRARAQIMTRFRSGEVWILITTDVLARGVDFAGVNGVVSYDVPSSAASYVHRAGRTGRAGREGGVAVTFYTKEDIPFVRSVANVIAASEKQAGDKGEKTVQKWLLDALPKVTKEDKRKLKVRGVEARRADTGKAKSAIGSKSGWERRRENNRKGAIEASKRRKREEKEGGAKKDTDGADNDDEFGGFDE